VDTTSPADPGPTWKLAYTLDEAEFIAAYRAGRMASNPNYGSRVVGFGYGFIAHFFMVACLEIAVLMALGKKGANQEPIPWFLLPATIVAAVISGYYLWSHVYCPGAYFKLLYRGYPLAGEKVVFTITSTRFAFRHKLAEVSTDWRLIPKVVELRDGFVLCVRGDPQWIPRKALGDEFAEVDLADFLRVRVPRCQVIDRAAQLPARSRRVKSVSGEAQ
jgi:hypothetical protein